MTPIEFLEARVDLGLSQAQLAMILGLGANGSVTVRRWEMPEAARSSRPPNPIACKMLEYLKSGELKLK